MTVYLVGAGPGDPGLLTRRGEELLRIADVVVYDRLASPLLLDLAPERAERIDVGKAPGRAAMTQEEINEVLVERGRAGQEVVRLKGGDPFVFGRGGEEAEACIAAGVPFEVVPGITSAIAAPAYAGIPVTHRGVSTSVTIVTGHEDPDQGNDSTPTGTRSRAAGGTLVILMGAGRLADIADALIDGGRAPDTPVAAVRWGTRPEQRTVRATLATIAAAGVEAPSAIVVGDVAALDFVWFEQRPLFGRRVVVTRAREQASELRDAARSARRRGDRAAVDRDRTGRLRDARSRRVRVARVHVRQRRRRVLRSWPRPGRARRPRAGAGARRRDRPRHRSALRDAWCPCRPRARTLRRRVAARRVPGTVGTRRARAARARRGRARRAARRARPRGATRSTCCPCTAPLLRSRTRTTSNGSATGAVDAITFTSSSTVTNFCDLVGDLPDPQPLVVLDRPGHVSDTARERGLRVDVEADPHTIAGLVDARSVRFGLGPSVRRAARSIRAWPFPSVGCVGCDVRRHCGGSSPSTGSASTICRAAVREGRHRRAGTGRVDARCRAAHAGESAQGGARARRARGSRRHPLRHPRHQGRARLQADAPDGVVQVALRNLRDEVGDALVLMVDNCLDEYTDHGHCGILTRSGEVDNDATLERYASIAVAQADAGADVIAPSGMMDGQVGAIRAALDGTGHETTRRSSRTRRSTRRRSTDRSATRPSARRSSATASSYQMDAANGREALTEVALDVDEGADMVMVKPALAYLDVIAEVRAAFDVPVAAYHVSGEYAMVKAAAQLGWIDGDAVALEHLLAIKRAGADAILTYFARDVAEWL